MRASRNRQQGVALVLVIWLATLLMVVASSFMLSARSDALVIANSMAMARAEAIAEAGVQRAAHELYRHDVGPDVWKRDGTPREWRFDGATVKIEIRDESARIDLNTASDALLKGLLLSVGLPEEEAVALLDAILDWRDPDTLKRVHGAEESDYASAGLSWRPANAPFQALEELQLVLGMRPELYRRMAPLLTVHSRQAGVSVQAASREVLLAIPNITAAQVDAFIARRDQAYANGQVAPPFIEGAAFVSPPSNTVASVRAEARLEDGTTFVRDSVLLLRGIPRRPVNYLAWRTGTMPEPPPAKEGDS
ncbi:general secretion pathway protein GspK [Usitatibacter palustris]|nr:type II secretion system protein GspK [Usitatibacter palustris]